jgi:hypothetical protein
LSQILNARLSEDLARVLAIDLNGLKAELLTEQDLPPYEAEEEAADRNGLMTLLERWKHPLLWGYLDSLNKRYGEERTILAQMHGDQRRTERSETLDETIREHSEHTEAIRGDLYRTGAEVGDIYGFVERLYPRLSPTRTQPARSIARRS